MQTLVSAGELFIDKRYPSQVVVWWLVSHQVSNNLWASDFGRVPPLAALISALQATFTELL